MRRLVILFALMGLLLSQAAPSSAAVFAQIIQYLATDQASGANAQIGAAYVGVDTSTGLVVNRSVYACTVTMATPKTWKSEIVACIVADAATVSLTVPTANVFWLTAEPGDFRRPVFVADWTQAATLTNIGTTAINVYTGSLGLAQLAPFASYSQYRFAAFGNKIGTGTLTIDLTDTTNAANTLTVTYSGTAGEFVADSGWTALPAWAVGEDLLLKPMARSSVASDDPVMRQFLLYLK